MTNGLTLTPAKQLKQQTIGSNNNQWGNYLNDTIGLIDSALGGTLTKAITGNTTLTLVDVRNTGYRFTGALSATATISFPEFYGLVILRNDTNKTLNCGITGQAVISVPSGVTIAGWSNGVEFRTLTSSTVTAGPHSFDASGLHTLSYDTDSDDLVYSVAGETVMSIDDIGNVTASGTISGKIVPQLLGAAQCDAYPFNVNVFDNYAFVYHDNIGGRGLEIFDISYPTPILISSLTDPDIAGYQAVFCGLYIITADSFTDKISVIQFLDPHGPTNLGSASTDAMPTSLSVISDNTFMDVYVANLNGNTIQVFDVFPTASTHDPAILRSTTAVSDPYLLLASGDLLFVFNYNGPLYLRIYDIADRMDPGLLSTIPALYAVVAGLAIRGDYLYADNGCIYDISDPEAPTVAAEFGDRIITGGGFSNIRIDGDFLYTLMTLTPEGDEWRYISEVRKYSLADPINPVLVSSLSVGSQALGLAVSDGYVYTAEHNYPSGYLGKMIL